MLIYWATRATGPTILVTVGITIQRVPSAFLVALLRFLKPLFELSYLFRQISHLSGISTAWFLQRGLLRGVEGLSWPVLLAAVLIEPATLYGVVGREQSINSLAPFAKLVGTPFLGVPFSGPPPCARFPFLGTCSPAILVAAATLALLVGLLLVCSLHAIGRCDKM